MLVPEIVNFKIQIVLEPSVLYRPGKWREYKLMVYDKNMMRVFGSKCDDVAGGGWKLRNEQVQI
jgi:hypothetical protein